MISSDDCYKKYGQPIGSNKCMVLWDVPVELEIGVIPKRIYCNKDIIQPLTESFKALIQTGNVDELITWDGCFNIRTIGGSDEMSLHSWGVAIDLNAFENQRGKIPRLSDGFVTCFTQNGFDWGGNFKRQDGMHFQLSKI